MKIADWPIEDVTPYPDNPRLISVAAVSAVAKSISRFGFRQPIVVDADGVIVMGHTRHLAAQRLGMDKVPVHVAESLTEEEARALRLLDNRSGEFSNWRRDLLNVEIRALADSFSDLTDWFPPAALEMPDAPKGFEDAIAVLKDEQASAETPPAAVVASHQTNVVVGNLHWMMPYDKVLAQVRKWELESDGSRNSLRRRLLAQLGIA